MSATINHYCLKIWLVGPGSPPMCKLHRVIEISGNAAFAALHDLILEAFDCADEEFYHFLLTRKAIKNLRELRQCDEEVVGYFDGDEVVAEDGNIIRHDALEYTLDDAKLKENNSIYYWYWFNSDDSWIYRIKIEKIRPVIDTTPEIEGWMGEVIKKVGPSPALYE